MAENENETDSGLWETASNIIDVLPEDTALWYKKRLQMPEVAGKTVILTRAEWRERASGGYYILHLTNKDGNEATVTTSSPKIKAKVSAIANRDAFPVKCKFVADSDTKGYDLVKGD